MARAATLWIPIELPLTQEARFERASVNALLCLHFAAVRHHLDATLFGQRPSIDGCLKYGTSFRARVERKASDLGLRLVGDNLLDRCRLSKELPLGPSPTTTATRFLTFAPCAVPLGRERLDAQLLLARQRVASSVRQVYTSPHVYHLHRPCAQA